MENIGKKIMGYASGMLTRAIETEAKHFATGEAATSTGPAGRSGTETLSEPVTIYQKGGDQAINACGGATVTGNEANIHNHPAKPSTSQKQGRKRKAGVSSAGNERAKKERASTSQRQGRKRKAAGSSGVKKRAKMGGPGTIYQRGGDQAINACGSSKVTDNKTTIHNHPTKASTSQRQGRKRKAAGSSGGKKRAKNGR